MYETMTQEMLQTQLLADMGITESVREGSFYDTVTRGASYALWRLYAQLDRVLAMAFPDATSGEAIDWRAADYGIIRKAGQHAESTIALTGRVGAVIPSGTVFLTLSGLSYATTADVTIGTAGTASATVRAVEAGAAYNVDTGAICVLQSNVDGLTSGVSTTPALGGMDAESDAALFARLDERRKRPATSGNIAQYEQWAREVDGVGDARALDCWNGAGTVKIVLVDMELRPVTEQVRAAVEAHIAAQRPAGGVAVTVVSAEQVTVNVSVHVILDTATTADTVRTQLAAAVTAYLKTLTFRASTLVYHRIAGALMNLDGVLDFSALTVNDGTANISLGDTQSPVLGTVEVIADVA